MRRLENVLSIGGIMIAATLGAGIFGLPYVFYASGWAISLGYLVFFSAGIAYAHDLYWRTLEKTEEKHRLVGLVRQHLGKSMFHVGVCAILGGLTLALVAYLILGSGFLVRLFPSLSYPYAVSIFWLFCAAPFFLNFRRLVRMELVGTICKIAFIFLIGWFAVQSTEILLFSEPAAFDFFLPFGPILFALAGWTAIEPIYEWAHKRKASLVETRVGLASGTIAVGIFYIIFVTAIFLIAPEITPDTISGLLTISPLATLLLAGFGIFALWTSYVPVGLEIEKSLSHELGWSPHASSLFVLCAPLFLVFIGFNDFLRVVSLVGGIFLSMEYMLLLSVARRVLQLRNPQRIILDALIAIFTLGAVYEIYYFVLH